MAANGGSSRDVGLVRNLGLFDITMIGVGAMIGAGIFVLTGIAAGTAGPALILAFALNGVITVLTAMVYAELGSAIPEAGGGYLWVKEGLPGPKRIPGGLDELVRACGCRQSLRRRLWRVYLRVDTDSLS